MLWKQSGWILHNLCSVLLELLHKCNSVVWWYNSIGYVLRQCFQVSGELVFISFTGCNCNTNLPIVLLLINLYPWGSVPMNFTMNTHVSAHCSFRVACVFLWKKCYPHLGVAACGVCVKEIQLLFECKCLHEKNILVCV